jgi:hypothetical protein
MICCIVTIAIKVAMVTHVNILKPAPKKNMKQWTIVTDDMMVLKVFQSDGIELRLSLLKNISIQYHTSTAHVIKLDMIVAEYNEMVMIDSMTSKTITMGRT